MRIAQIAPLAERVPPKKYGGTERVIYALTEALVTRGHEVTLYASGDSITTARLVSVYPKGLREARLKDIYGSNLYTLINIGVAYDHQDSYDIIHDHNGFLSLPTANLARTPVVTTYHGPFTAEAKKIFGLLRGPHVVTISESQAHGAGNMHHIGTVYNGLDFATYPFSARHDGYLLCVGRFSPEKGIHNAVAVAQALDMPLIIAAKLETLDLPYFRQYIEPYLSDRIEWIGEVDTQRRNELMSRAYCFLHPVEWREPFGLTLIEAQACGAPVVAFNKGSIPEIVAHGETGFVVNDVEEMVEAMLKVDTIEREACRVHARTRFSAEKMADGYEAIYAQILNGA